MKKWLKRLTVFAAIVLLLCALGIAIFSVRCSSPQQPSIALRDSPHPNPPTTNLSKDIYARPQEDTYFTYPEWYIVWSYQEKAGLQQSHLPSRFPFFGEINQYWCAYCAVNRIVTGRYPFNFGDHLMLMVIGSSFSVEYALKGGYEKTLGWLSEWTSSGEFVEEDSYAATVAKEYAEFVHIRPFYEFSFSKALRGLWSKTSAWGRHPLRKWERKAFLSLDYAVEAVYCGLLTGITHAIYGVETADTYAWIATAPAGLLEANRHIGLKQSTSDAQLIVIPRYQEFTDTAIKLTNSGVQFLSIAGNDEVLITVIAPTQSVWNRADAQMLFKSPILTNSELVRIGLRCQVATLNVILPAVAASGWKIEHIYDF